MTAPLVARSRTVVRWGWPVALLGVAFFLATRPRSQLYGRTVAGVPTGKRWLALTFDDGPSEPFTGQILDILKRERVPATFFMVGQNVERHPALAIEVVREGHAIGNHTYGHNWLDALRSWTYPELDRAQRVFKRTVGVSPRYFRPPLGIHTPWQLRAVRRAGMLTIQWNIEANDPHRPGADVIVRRVLDSLRPGGVILLHDGEGTMPSTDRGQTVAALPRILTGAREAGFEFVSLDRLLASSATRGGCRGQATSSR